MGNRLKPTTMNIKTYMIETKLIPYFGNLKVNAITTIIVRQWQNKIMTTVSAIDKPYSQTYMKSINNQLSAIFNYAVSHYSLPVNPCKISGTIGKSKANKMSIWTNDEYEKFVSYMTKPTLKLAFDILFFTGMRLGELLALKPPDILSDKKINICKNFAKVKGVDFILEPKTPKSKRCISIPEFLYNDIIEYIEDCPEKTVEDRIFSFPKISLNKELHRVAIFAELKRIRVHDLRHSHASLLIDMGFDIIEISERLGHESAKITWDTYAHLYPDKDKKLASALNELR